jgi:hypothetical protein
MGKLPGINHLDAVRALSPNLLRVPDSPFPRFPPPLSRPVLWQSAPKCTVSLNPRFPVSPFHRLPPSPSRLF